MAKMKNDYFKLMEQQVSYCVQASDLLGEILSKYSAAEIPQQREKMHAIEHQADALRHDILSRLSTEFITPMDQEDLLEMVQILTISPMLWMRLSKISICSTSKKHRKTLLFWHRLSIAV